MLNIYHSTSETWIGNFFQSHKQLQDQLFRRNIVLLNNIGVGEFMHIHENPEITHELQTGIHKFTDEQQNTVRSPKIGSGFCKSTDSHENAVRSLQNWFRFHRIIFEVTKSLPIPKIFLN